LLVGTPGIGKTVLGFLMVHEFIFLGRRVVYYGNLPYLLVLENSQVTRYYMSSIDKILPTVLTPETVFIIDGREPPYLDFVVFRCILISSPRSSIFNEYAKQAKKLYLPTWTEEEVESCRESCYPDTPPQVANKLFKINGGVVRRIFGQLAEVSGQDTLEECVSALKLEELDQAVNTQNLQQFQSRLIHMNPTGSKYDKVSWDFASNLVSSKCMERWLQYSALQVSKFLGLLFSGGNTEDLYGRVFEEYAHNVLAYGNLSKCRWKCTSDASKTSLDLVTPGKMDWFPLQNWSSFKQDNEGNLSDSQKSKYDESIYWRPYSRNFPSFDSAYGSVAYQITASKKKKKECKLKDVKDWLSICRKDTEKECHIVKIIPLAFWDTSSNGIIVMNGKNTVVKNLPTNVNFWVLGIPLEGYCEEVVQVLKGLKEDDFMMSQSGEDGDSDGGVPSNYGKDASDYSEEFNI
jgi:hypothetical protein